MGIIKNDAVFNTDLLSEFEDTIRSMQASLAWDKKDIIELFFKMIPDFAHKETGKYLDEKM